MESPESVDFHFLTPQGPDFIYVDRLQTANDAFAESRYTVKGSEVLFGEGKLSAPALIENAGQTSGAWEVWMNREKGKAVPMGYLASVSDVNVARLPAEGETIITTIKRIAELGQNRMYSAETRIEEERIFTCRFTTSYPEQIQVEKE